MIGLLKFRRVHAFVDRCNCCSVCAHGGLCTQRANVDTTVFGFLESWIGPEGVSCDVRVAAGVVQQRVWACDGGID